MANEYLGELIDNVELIEGGVCDLPALHNNTFDLVTSSLSVHFDRLDFFQEANRLLKPGGALIYSEVHPIVSSGEESKIGCLINSYFDMKNTRVQKNVFGKLHQDDPDYYWKTTHTSIEKLTSDIIRSGFLIKNLYEPKPNRASTSNGIVLEKMYSKYPIFIILNAIKCPLCGQGEGVHTCHIHKAN